VQIGAGFTACYCSRTDKKSDGTVLFTTEWSFADRRNDHDNFRIDFERLLRAEISCLGSIDDTNKKWCEAVHAGAVPFSFAFDKELTKRYRKWVLNARICLQQLELQEAKECHPESATEFRERLEAAEELLLERTQDEAAAIAALQGAG
jgi:hypothetical protein